MKKHTHKQFNTVALLLLSAALCLVIAAITWVVLTIPDRAAASFGPASPALGNFQLYSYAFRLEFQKEKLLSPVKTDLHELKVTIKEGDSIQVIADTIDQSGLLADRDLFIDYLVYSGLDTRIQAGNHTLTSQMNAVEIAQELIDPNPDEVIFGLLAGWRVEEIATLIPASGLNFNSEDFLERVQNPSGLVDNDFWGSPSTLEGLLAPGEFTVRRDTNLDDFLLQLKNRQMLNFTPGLIDRLAEQGLTPYEGLILASIVEREAVVDEEKPMIASVFLNRLAIGMRLDSDPTVQYAAGYNAIQATWWSNPISWEQLQIDSPYNTYIYSGLPPAPICTPSLKAIEAVAFPEDSLYYYFRAACDGSGKHLFAETYEEHLLNECP
ncbi:MAG TPA: endolytic transglycosylase MltG [Anaerolineaceae bacterium]|nr:endolytic transglycosylase MltG [Anaerolineaceae bacterium]